MSVLNFQHEESETPFGIFHPTGYIIAAFDSLDTASAAADKLLTGDFDSDKVEAVAGEQVQQALEQAHPPGNLLEKIKETLATTVGSEGFFWDEDMRLAKQGAGFVTVYCADSEQAHAAAALLGEFSPKSMRRYRSFAIEDLMQSATPD